MIRTQVQLTEEQQERLKALAARRGVSISAVIREGIENVLAVAETGEQWEKLCGVVGAFSDPNRAFDVAERHDEYLKEGVARGKSVR